MLLTDKVSQFATDSNIVHDWVHGTGTVTTEGGVVRSPAKLIADLDASINVAAVGLLTAAGVSASAAAASAALAQGYLTAYRATSYGALASDPTLDPNGGTPTVGDEYFNTTSNLLKRFNGATWQASDINTANLAASGGSSLVGYLPMGVASESTVQAQFRNTVLSANYSSLQAAITDAAAIGKLLRVTKAAYSIPAPGLTIPSNSNIVFDAGTTVTAAVGYGSADVLVNFDGATNVFMDCSGVVFAMPKAEYTTGEWRHGFNLINCSNVLVVNPKITGTGGDGFYINGATDTTIENPVSDNARRQGMSIIKATRLRVIAPVLKNTIGAAPQAGLDIEPNSATDGLQDIVIDSPVCTGNAGSGFVIYLDDYKTGSPSDVQITINNPVSRGNGQYGYSVANVFLNTGSYGGFIAINSPVSDSDGYPGIRIVDKGVNAPLLKITAPVITNACAANAAYPNHTAILVSDSSATISGGIHISDVSVKNTGAGMDYGVYVESGQGFTDLRVGVENITGHLIETVRWGNSTSAIADVSTALVDVSKLMGTAATTSGSKNITGDLAGKILTNAGASGAITFFLREYLPPGNVYRFRVEAAQSVSIDVYDPLDRIVGTTVAAALVSSSVIGAEAEVSYLGTFAGVRYWRFTPLGNSASWTFA